MLSLSIARRYSTCKKPAAGQGRAGTVGQGDHVFGALAGDLRNDPGTKRIVIREEPDPRVEIEIPAGGPPPRQIERSAGIGWCTIGDRIDPAAVRVDAKIPTADGLPLEADDAAGLVGGRRSEIENLPNVCIRVEHRCPLTMLIAASIPIQSGSARCSPSVSTSALS